MHSKSFIEAPLGCYATIDHIKLVTNTAGRLLVGFAIACHLPSDSLTGTSCHFSLFLYPNFKSFVVRICTTGTTFTCERRDALFPAKVPLAIGMKALREAKSLKSLKSLMASNKFCEHSLILAWRHIVVCRRIRGYTCPVPGAWCKLARQMNLQI